MHILVVNNVYPPIMAGGAELIVAWLSEGLVQRGHRVTVVSTCGPEMEPYPVEVRHGVTVIRYFPRNLYWNFARDGQPAHRRALWHLRDAWNRDAARRFHVLMAKCKPNIVHTHLIDGLSASIWRKARQSNVPVIHTAHDYHLICPRAFMLTRDWRICRRPSAACRMYRTWHLRTARYVNMFVSPSGFLLEQHKLAGLPQVPTAIVRNGIPMPQSKRQRASGRTTFLCLTRLTVEKGIRVVLQAMQRLPATTDIELVIAGRGPLELEVRQAAASDSRVRFVGYVSGQAKTDLLETADHLIIPSLWYENAPVAVVEATAYGLGVIASRIGGLPELVEHGRTGFLFDPGDAEGLAGIIGGLSNGQTTLPDLAVESSALLERHSLDRMVESYLEHYTRLISENGNDMYEAEALRAA